MNRELNPERYPILWNEEKREELRITLKGALERKDYTFARDLMEQIPKQNRLNLCQFIDGLRSSPQLLSLVLEMLTDEEWIRYWDYIDNIEGFHQRP